MLFKQRQKLFPKVYVECRLFVAFYPAAISPAVYPAFFDRVYDVFGIGRYCDLARFLQRGKSCYHGGKLHSVVCCVSRSTRNFLFLFSVHKYAGVAARTRISAARAVGIYVYFLQNRAPPIPISDLLYNIPVSNCNNYL